MGKSSPLSHKNDHQHAFRLNLCRSLGLRLAHFGGQPSCGIGCKRFKALLRYLDLVKISRAVPTPTWDCIIQDLSQKYFKSRDPIPETKLACVSQ